MPTLPDCSLPENCGNPDCQKKLADDHEISTSNYNAYCLAFFGREVPAAKSYSRDAINAMLADVNCSSSSIWISADFNDTTSNSDIVVQVASTAPAGSYTTRYSIAMFKGVLLAYDPDSLQFSKATENSRNCVIFKAIKNGNIVYCGDVGSLFP